MVKTKILCVAMLAGMLSGSCKKAVDNIKQDLMVQLITNNTWVITNYTEGTENKTADYSPYAFKFNKDWSVNAMNNGVSEATGTWLGSEANQSITSDFPNATAPLDKLNGVWIVTNTKSKPWRVYSHRFEGAKEIVLNLQEK